VRSKSAEGDESDFYGEARRRRVCCDGVGKRGEGKRNKGVVCSCAPGCRDVQPQHTNVGDDGGARMVTAGWVLGRPVSASGVCGCSQTEDVRC